MCGFVVTTENNKADTYIDAQRFRGPDARGETIRLSPNFCTCIARYIRRKRNPTLHNK